VAAEVEIKLGWVCYAGVNGGSRGNVATCTTLKNEKKKKTQRLQINQPKRKSDTYKPNKTPDNFARDDLVRLTYL